MLLSKRAEDALVSIAESLQKLVSNTEPTASGTGLRTNYSDYKVDQSFFSEVSDEQEFLRDLKEAARVAAGLPPESDEDGQTNP